MCVYLSSHAYAYAYVYVNPSSPEKLSPELCTRYSLTCCLTKFRELFRVNIEWTSCVFQIFCFCFFPIFYFCIVLHFLLTVAIKSYLQMIHLDFLPFLHVFIFLTFSLRFCTFFAHFFEKQRTKMRKNVCRIPQKFTFCEFFFRKARLD